MKINISSLKLLLLLATLSVVVTYFIPVVQAQGAIGEARERLEDFRVNKIGAPSFGSPSAAIFAVINWFLGFIAAVALAVMLWGGFTYITSLGSDDKVRSAKRIILFAIVGLLMIAGAWVIIAALETILAI